MLSNVACVLVQIIILFFDTSFRSRSRGYTGEIAGMSSDYLLDGVPDSLLRKPSILHQIKSPHIYLLSQVHLD